MRRSVHEFWVQTWHGGKLCSVVEDKGSQPASQLGSAGRFGLQPGDDSLQVTSGSAYLYGGSGNDTLTAQNTTDWQYYRFYGDEGSDVLIGGHGSGRIL